MTYPFPMFMQQGLTCDGTLLPEAYPIETPQKRSLVFDKTQETALFYQPVNSPNVNEAAFGFGIKLHATGIPIVVIAPGAHTSTVGRGQLGMNANGQLVYQTRRFVYRSEEYFRDISAWYHFLITRIDQDTARAWCNGKEITFTKTSAVTQPEPDYWFSSSRPMYIGKHDGLTAHNSERHMSASLSYVFAADGVSITDPLDTGSFDDTTGEWIPKNPDTAGWVNNSFLLTGDVRTDNAWAGVYKLNDGGLHVINSAQYGKPGIVFVRDPENGGSTHVFTEHNDNDFFRTNTDAALQDAPWYKEVPGGMSIDASVDTVAFEIKSDPSKGAQALAWSGTTGNRLVAHDLPAEPEFLMVKENNIAGDTAIYVKDVTTPGNGFVMASTANEVALTGVFDDANMSASDIALGANSNLAGVDYTGVAICSVPGYTYVTHRNFGGGTTFDPGFRVAAMLTKNTASGGAWELYYDITDTRSTYWPMSSTAPNGTGTAHHSGPTEINIPGATTNYLVICFADTNYLRQFLESEVGDISFEAVNFTGFQEHSLDNPLNNFPTINGLDIGITSQVLSKGSRSWFGSGAAGGVVPLTHVIPTKGVYYVEFTRSDGNAWIQLKSPSVLVMETYNVDGTYQTHKGGEAADTTPFPSGYAVFGLLIDVDDSRVDIYVDGNVFKSLNGVVGLDRPDNRIYVGDGSPTSSAGTYGTINVGDKPFVSPPPVEFSTLGSAETALTLDTISPSDYFAITDFTMEASNFTVSLPIDAEMVWIKRRRTSSQGWLLLDKVRANGRNRALLLDATGAEGSSFPGISLGDGELSVDTSLSAAGHVYDVLCFRRSPCAGIDFGVYNGSLTSNGQTAVIPYDVGGAADFLANKRIDATAGWLCQWRGGMGSDAHAVGFDTNQDESTGSEHPTNSFWGNTPPDDSGFTTGFITAQNVAGGEYLYIAFRNVPGVSAIGAYATNGNIDGPFAPMTVRPAVFIQKGIDINGGGWHFYNGKNEPNNPVTQRLALETTSTEQTYPGMDLLSTGVKVRSAHASENPSGKKIGYLAFGDMPSTLANAR